MVRTLARHRRARPRDALVRQPAASGPRPCRSATAAWGPWSSAAPPSERIQFNEDTLWAGGPHDYAHAGAAEYLPEIRKLLFEGKQREAEKLATEHFMSVPLRQMPYQPFGDLLLEFPGHEAAADYRRELDLDTGVATTGTRSAA